ncbi:MAG: hypothetical protein IKG87_10055 [Clostridia bacterium]|nr:hypothetical protein [Clostridia bacterium]
MRILIWLGICVIWLIITIVAFFREGFSTVMNSDKAWGLIVPLLSFIGFFIYMKLAKKAEVGPPEPEGENASLDALAKLTIIRDSSIVGAIVPTVVFLNGQQACSIKNGESAVIELTQKHNVLMTNATGSSKVRIEFDAPSGGIGSLHVKANEFQAKTLVWKGDGQVR